MIVIAGLVSNAAPGPATQLPLARLSRIRHPRGLARRYERRNPC